MIGKTLGHYEITSLLGKGEVYHARDEKLGRDVAIKVLPEELARDHDRTARFQREARLLASLNHPNIAAIHGLEESGGTQFLVLELIEGETLADRLKRGPIPVEDSLKLGVQIAEALETAHEKGVIHRDLKPANIKITPDGKVKVLDFGLAKAFAGEQAETNPSNSPTLSSTATQQGVILGTAAYMSPEQARGKPVDKRADIWAFGCVLFEVLTGRAAFLWEDISEILASVIRSEPDWSRLPENLHWRTKELLERCMEKEVRNRYGSISDARVEIQKALADTSGVLAQPVATTRPRNKLRTMLPWVAAALFLGLIIAGEAIWNLKPSEPRQIIRSEYSLPEGQQFSNLTYSVLAVSPNGNQFAYSTPKGIYLKSLDQWAAKLILGTEGETQWPFFSPDGQSIGYISLSDKKLKKVTLNGGVPVVLCSVVSLAGLSWGRDDKIYYSEPGKGILRISANGGTPEILFKAGDNEIFYHPRLLPDGKSVLFTVGPPPYKIAIQSLESPKPNIMFEGDNAYYLPTGHLVYTVGYSLYARLFDPEKLKPAGDQISIVEGIIRSFQGVPQYSVSASGTLAYMSQGAATGKKRKLFWVDRKGKESPLSADPNEYLFPRISIDGKSIALAVRTGDDVDISVLDLASGILTPLTFEEGEDNCPLWTPDGREIIYRSFRSGGGSGNFDINRKAANGTGEVERLGSSPYFPLPFSWSRDGNTLLLWELTLVPRQTDITMLSMKGNHERMPLLHEKHSEDYPQVSPNGKWLAYGSNKTGQNEIYVRPFPEVNKGFWQVSTGGGFGPLWAPDGRELFYRNGDSIMAVPVETDPAFKRGKPEELFSGTYYSMIDNAFVIPMWDIHPDGKRFLMIKPSWAASPEVANKINIVLNWLEELRQRVPEK